MKFYTQYYGVCHISKEVTVTKTPRLPYKHLLAVVNLLNRTAAECGITYYADQDTFVQVDAPYLPHIREKCYDENGVERTIVDIKNLYEEVEDLTSYYPTITMKCDDGGRLAVSLEDWLNKFSYEHQ